MILTPYFLLNLFCGFFSCDYNYDLHNSAAEPTSKTTSRVSRVVNNDDKSDLTRRASADYFAGIEGSNPTHVVATQAGAVEGFSMRTAKQREIHAFEGVPYGEAPVGNWRFRSPRPKLPWRGVRDAKAPGSYCAQLNSGHLPQIFGKEDCLFLNIYTPKLNEKTKSEASLPVIVYFHGGAFMLGGSQDTGPAYLLDQDIVLVTVNYRLGLLGFLSTSDEASPGNYGLKDQALALQWVNKNIAKFGGNNSQVTLLGNSAGAASVHLHMLANKTREYFSAGISTSGTAFNPWVFAPERLRIQTNDKLAKLTRCPLAGTTNSEAFVNCLRKVKVHTLVGQQNFLTDAPQLPAVLFGPVVESPSPDAFLTETPQKIYRQNKAAKYPWITSLVKDECEGFIIILQSFGMLGPLLNRWKNSSSLVLDYKYRESLERGREITKNISQYYFGAEQPRLEDAQTIGQAWSDRYFNFPAHQAIVAHSKVAPTYVSVFGYKGGPSVAGHLKQDRNKWGVVHGEDEFYYFNRSSAYPTFKPTDPDYAIAKFMTTVAANFAKNREPVYTNDFDKSEVRVWESVDPEDSRPIRYLLIDKEVKMVDEPHGHRVAFWEALNLK